MYEEDMRVVAIVQARMGGATRFGGPKVLADIEGKPMVQRVLERVSRARMLDWVMLAIPDTTENEELAAWYFGAAKKGLGLYRGPEHDALARYIGAAERASADVIVRVTADCPCVDWRAIDAMVAIFIQRFPSCQYFANNLETPCAHGLDVEVVSLSALKSAQRSADARAREHVTTMFRPQEPEHRGGPRLTVDYPEDLEVVRNVYRELGNSFSGIDVVKLWDARPELFAANEKYRV